MEEYEFEVQLLSTQTKSKIMLSPVDSFRTVLELLANSLKVDSYVVDLSVPMEPASWNIKSGIQIFYFHIFQTTIGNHSF
jgi:hypothetical protein